MARLYLATPYGDQYHIHDGGRIQRLDQPDFQPSATWVLLGIQHVKRAEFIPFDQLTRERIATLTLRYKNGKPQYTVRDCDHGTVRVWGNTRAHGIADLRRID